jgi:hypothetical protein
MTMFVRALARLTVILTLVAIISPSVRAQDADFSVEFTSINAVADYPLGISFSIDFETDQPITRAELLYASDGDQSLRLVTVPVGDPGARSLAYFLDLQIYYYPPGIDFVYQWRLTAVNGQRVESDQQRAPWIDDRFEWSYVQTEQVQVASYDGNAEFAEDILNSAQMAIDKIQNDLGAELDQQVRIWAYTTLDDFSGTKAPNSESWSVGVAYPSLKVILAVLPTGDTTEVGRVVPHEISHQVMWQAIRNPFNVLPTWLEEGIAVTYQENGNSHFPGMVQAAADRGELFSVRALNANFPYDSSQATLGYAQSFSIVTFIRETWGDEALAILTASYQNGVSHDEASLGALGVDLAELDRLWKESLGYAGDRAIGSAVDDDRSDSFWGGLLASGALVWVLIAVLAVAVGLKSIVGTRRETAEEDDSSAFRATFRL